MSVASFKAAMLAALNDLEPEVATVAETVAQSAIPGVGGVVAAEVIAVADAAFRKSPAGIAASSAATVAAAPPPAPVKSVDVTASPLVKVPTDLASVIAFAVALADKVDALTAAAGLQGSAAMADHA